MDKQIMVMPTLTYFVISLSGMITGALLTGAIISDSKVCEIMFYVTAVMTIINIIYPPMFFKSNSNED